MKQSSSTNTFTGGLVQDLNPLNNVSRMLDVLTNCLNGTLITYNGNEYVLLNDMGNGRVETAYLPEGFIPVGTAELGGIIYIISYNPLTLQSLIGSFPSPERNITSDDVLPKNAKELTYNDLITEKSIGNGTITKKYACVKSPKYKLTLLDKEINPGDKFQIYSLNINKFQKFLSAYSSESELNINKIPKYLKLHVVCVDSQGSITFLDDNLVWENDYYIKSYENENDLDDIDEYRNLVESNYNVFISRSKGTLAILAELECIDTFEVTWDADIKDYIPEDEKKVLFNKLADITFTLKWSYDNEYAPNEVNLNKFLFINTDIMDYPIKEVTNIKDDTNNYDKDNCEYKYLYKLMYNLVSTTDTSEIDTLDLTIGTVATIASKPGDFANFSPLSLQEIQHYTIIPGMEFGYMDYLAKTIDINISKLGTGDTDLIEWKYYVNDSNIILNWGLDCYPEKNKQVNKVTFDFFKSNSQFKGYQFNNPDDYEKNININIDLDKYNDKYRTGDPYILNWTKFEKESGTEYLSPDYTIVFDDKESYSGHFTEDIHLMQSSIDEGLKPNDFYLVRITINYSGEDRYFYRIIHTCKVFNQTYLDNINTSNFDFKNIQLGTIDPPKVLVNNVRTTWGTLNTKYENNGDILDINKNIYLEETVYDKTNIHNTTSLEMNATMELVSDCATFDLTGCELKENTVSSPLTFTNNAELIFTDYKDDTFEDRKINYDIFGEYKFQSNGCNINIQANDLFIYTPFNARYETSKTQLLDYELTQISHPTPQVNNIRLGETYLDVEMGETKTFNAWLTEIWLSMLEGGASSATLGNLGTHDYTISNWKFGQQSHSAKLGYHYMINNILYNTDSSGDNWTFIKSGELSNISELTLVLTYAINYRNGACNLINFVAEPTGSKKYYITTPNDDTYRKRVSQSADEYEEYLNNTNYSNSIEKVFDTLYKWAKPKSNNLVEIYTLSNLNYYSSYLLTPVFKYKTNNVIYPNTYTIGDSVIPCHGSNNYGIHLAANLDYPSTGFFPEFELIGSSIKIDTSDLYNKLNKAPAILAAKVDPSTDKRIIITDLSEVQTNSVYQLSGNNYNIIDTLSFDFQQIEIMIDDNEQLYVTSIKWKPSSSGATANDTGVIDSGLKFGYGKDNTGGKSYLYFTNTVI